jgi:hypothetical protein
MFFLKVAPKKSASRGGASIALLSLGSSAKRSFNRDKLIRHG